MVFFKLIPCLVSIGILLPGWTVWGHDRGRERDQDEAEFTREHHEARICSNTAQAAFNACEYDNKDNFWIAHGKCLNNGGRQAARDCIREARAELREAQALCGEQKRARRNICEALGEEACRPAIDPNKFLSPEAAAAVPNPYFPLVPGLVRVLRAGEEVIAVTVTNETREILGVHCRVVHDLVEENGEIIEDTTDWYAQDIFGNVWYFGEISKNLENGELNNLDGSWQAWAEDVQPGIIMMANPEIGDIYRQEFTLDEAEDMGEVISNTETPEMTPAANCAETCVVTRDFLPIDPGHLEKKFYAPGIGNILVFDQDTEKREELIHVIQP